MLGDLAGFYLLPFLPVHVTFPAESQAPCPQPLPTTVLLPLPSARGLIAHHLPSTQPPTFSA